MDDELLAVLADPARWRLVCLLAEHPRPVGVLAQLAGARQPQTTKHLQILERAGVVTSQREGQRRVYTLRSTPLRRLAATLGGLADTADRRSTPPRADHDDAPAPEGRSHGFTRSLTADPEVVWRHLTNPDLLARWWAPADRVGGLVFEARPGGRIALRCRAATGPVRVEGVVEEVRPGARLAYRLGPLLPGGGAAFTAHVVCWLRPAGTDTGTDLDVGYRISGGTPEQAAGVEPGLRRGLDRLAALTD